MLWEGPIQPARQQLFTSALCKEVRKHMTWASWQKLLCLFKVYLLGLVEAGRFTKGVYITCTACHISAGLCMSFPSEMGAEAVLWIVWNNTTQTTTFSWSRNFTDGSHTRTGKIVFFLKENCCCLSCFLFNIYLTVCKDKNKKWKNDK